MDVGLLAGSLVAVTVCAIVIMRGCDSFEAASQYLGRNMPPGVRGATINAVASSLPELFTTAALLVFFAEEDGYSGGIATCAGSAVFNAVVIPGLCVTAVLFYGVRRDGRIVKVRRVAVGRTTLFRDGVFLLATEAVLIYFLSRSVLSWRAGAVLVLMYGAYVAFLVMQMRRSGPETEQREAGPAEAPPVKNHTVL